MFTAWICVAAVPPAPASAKPPSAAWNSCFSLPLATHLAANSVISWWTEKFPHCRWITCCRTHPVPSLDLRSVKTPKKTSQVDSFWSHVYRKRGYQKAPVSPVGSPVVRQLKGAAGILQRASEVGLDYTWVVLEGMVKGWSWMLA